MGLKEYAQKRDFKKTPEPGPAEPAARGSGRGGFFCVQRHDASRLHYDFRLEVNGVLVSWAVPKGPSLDPDRKALAMKVEDHPLDYGTFEGNIPEGNYGGGSVMLWDTGTFNVLGEPSAQEQLERGDFKFELHGTKLKGSFAIVHIKGSPKRSSKGNEWLLLKKKDEFSVPQYDIDQFAWSVKTQRTQAEIAADAAPVSPESLPGARKAAAPASITPMLATLATKPPAGSQWLYEVKWDGVRALCHLRHGDLAIFSRRGLRCEKQYPELAALASSINAKEAWLDGEICILDPQGRSRFELIQPRIHANLTAVKSLSETSPVTLFLFDLLYMDGYDLRGATLEDRKRLLARIVKPSDDVRISEAFETDGEHMFQAARQMKLEGVVAKDRHSRYAETRSTAWQKVKVNNEDEFVIAGFTKGERDYFGALVLGVKEGNSLRHVGQVGTGFDQKLMKEIHARLEPLITKACPIKPKPNLKDVTWVKPEVVCQVRFLERTQDGMLRAPVFVALRDDKTVEATTEPPSDLDWSGRELIADVDGHRLKFTNLDKLFFPKDGWKKRDLLQFYDSVSPWLLPHLKNRPLSMKRYPNGIAADYFFQKNATHFPDWLHCVPIEESDPPKTNNYPLANDKASLLYLVNLGCIDQNPFMSRVESLDKPDWMLLDLDPVETSYDQIVEAALLIRALLGELGLQGYPKTTGGDGMHIYVPLEPVYSFEQVRSFAEILSHLAVERAPNLFTTPRSVEKRKKARVYFDYLQIGSGKTISSPYVVRAYDGAPVATPLAWGEVVRGLRPQQFRIDNSIARFQQVGDLFAPVLEGGQRLETALSRLQEPAKPAKKRAKTSSATR
jgi:bifunctional non-homologous end joining protein LigD